MPAQKKHFPLRPIPLFVMIFMIVLTIGFALVIKFQLDKHLRDSFDMASQDITQKISERILIYNTILKGGKGLFQITASPTRQQWRDYINTLDSTKNYHGIMALGYISYVTSGAKNSFTQSIRAQGVPNYTIHPNGERQIYTPVVYVEPLEGNESILGFDMFSDPGRRSALEYARDTGEEAVTDRIILQNKQKDIAKGFLLFMPVYKNNVSLQTVDQRRANISGYVYGVFRNTTLIQGIVNNPNNPDLDYELYDNNKIINAEHLLYDVIPHRDAPTIVGFSTDKTITVANHTWLFKFHTLPQFFLREKSRFITLTFLLGGITVSILVGFLLNFLIYGKERAEKIAELMTEKLRESEERYRTIFERLQDVYYETDLHGKVTMISPSIESYTGIKSEDIIGKDATEFYKNPEQRNVLLEQLKKHGEVRDYEVQLVGKDNHILTTSVTAQVLHNAVGLPRGVGGILRDMTTRKLREETILENIADGIIATDKNGVILFVNNATEVMLQANQKKLLGKKIIEVMKMFDAQGNKIPDAQRPIVQVLHSAKPLQIQREYEKADHTRFPAAITIAPIIQEGIIVGTVQVIRDITAQKNLEKQKNDFISITAHQLRTPLGIIRWSIESLFKNKLTQPLEKPLQEIYATTLQLIVLVNDLLDVSRIEQKQIVDHIEKIDILPLVQNSMKGLENAAKTKKISVKLLTEERTITLYIDASRFSQVIQNVLSNAIKYNKEHGSVTIRITQDAAVVNITIEDTGIGIPAIDKQRIFEKFSRGSNVQTTNVEGTGLGLFVVKSYIEHWGGHVSIESKLGKGTTVKIEIPKKKGKE